MPKIIEGELQSHDLRFALIVARFNRLLTAQLEQGAMDALRRSGAKEANITVVRVPGSFEIPQAAKKIAAAGSIDAVICLGVLIRGETPHFDHIATEVSRSLAALTLEYPIPIIYGIVTADTVEQAINRAGLKHGNKGFDAAMAAVELANAYRKLAKER
ncbi:MAG TPA: 6,7-dimethyl-8-ribityllumazine synthase [Acidobacteriota bacterium]|nr:6,7-dimethyl-8-ribityllumazine synthase [Acidobacteriota bacterium]